VPSDDNNVCVLKIGLKQVGLHEYCLQEELLQKSQILEHLSDDEKRVLLDSAKVRSFSSGQVIQLEEDPAGEFLNMVIDGGVVLTFGGGITDLGTLGPGDYFSLDSIYRSAVHPRANALGAVRVARLPAAMINALRQSYPLLDRILKDTAAQRKQMAEDGADFFNRW